MSWFRGDLHVHSQLSVGADLRPVELVAEARAAGLDFFAVTEHNLDADMELWRPHAGGLLVLPGRESTGESGHRVTVGNGDAAELLRIAAHPHAPYPGGSFVEPMDSVDVVEVWNGAWTSDALWQADNEAALADWHRALIRDVPTGRWRPAVGNSDAHLTGQIGTPHNVVPAAALRGEVVLAAVRGGGGWIAESADVELRVGVVEVVAGTEAGAGAGGSEKVVGVEVTGVDEGYVSVYSEEGEIHRHGLGRGGSVPVRLRVGVGDAMFVRVEVRYRDGRMAALSNPVVLTLR